MHAYEGSCHCGAIKFSFKAEPVTKGVRCNCSICRRKGTVMSPFALAPEELHINADKNQLGLYQFGNKVAKHYFCKTCGIYPFHETLRMPGHFRVNLGCIDEIDPYSLETDIFDGKSL